ncbi:MAG: hypothetical protein KF841_08775 [Phycisphaerae bacterium]|nr:hypothetical protein [Phycisphaerae bacterium]
MATRPSLGVGGIVGAAVGLAVVGALVASPLYLSPFQSEKQLLAKAAADPIEKIRRVLLNLDESLVALADARAASEQELRLDTSRIDEILKQSQGLVAKDLLDALSQSAQAMQAIEQSDRDRGTAIAGDSVKSGQLQFRTAPNELKNKYVAAHKELLTKAATAVRELENARGGDANTSNLLGANRIKAILDQAKGRIERNRAAFEAWQAEVYRKQASSLVDSVTLLQRIAGSLEAEAPNDVIADLTRQIEEQEKEITGLKSTVAQIAQAVAQAEGRVGELEEVAVLSRRRMSELEAQGAPIHEPDSEYGRLSEAARNAEAAIDILRNGTIANAQVVSPPPGGDMLETKYEGGDQQLGIRDLLDRVQQRKEQLASREKFQATLIARKADMVKQRDEMKARARAALQFADEQLGQIDQLLSIAEKHLRLADSAAVEAAKSLQQSALWSVKAVTGATNRQNDARSEATGATEMDQDRIKMISEDVDMKAAAEIIGAESLLMLAITHADQYEWIRSDYEVRLSISRRTGRDEPIDMESKYEDLRVKAMSKASEAAKIYASVGKTLAGSSSKIGSATIQGKDQKWQSEIGEATAHLLLASLAASDDERRTEQDAAYALLKGVVQGREQSPNAQAAIQAFLYLQEKAN